MEHRIATALVVDKASDDDGVVFTPAVETGGKTGARIFVSALKASGTIALTAELQQSVDLMNWTSGLFTTTSLTTAPATVAAETTTSSMMPLAGYVRVKFVNTANSVVVGAVLSFFDFNA